MRYIAGTPTKIVARRLLDGIERDIGPELPQQIDGDAEGGSLEEEREPGDVRHRHARDHLVVAQARGVQRGGRRTTEESAMCELGPLRVPRRARRVQERGDVVGVDRHRLGGLHPFEFGCVADDHRGGRIVHDVFDLRRAHQRVHRHGDAAGARHGLGEQEHGVAVRERHHDAIAGCDAPAQCARPPPDNRGGALEGEAKAAIPVLLHERSGLVYAGEPLGERRQRQVTIAEQLEPPQQAHGVDRRRADSS